MNITIYNQTPINLNDIAIKFTINESSYILNIRTIFKRYTEPLSLYLHIQIIRGDRLTITPLNTPRILTGFTIKYNESYNLYQVKAQAWSNIWQSDKKLQLIETILLEYLTPINSTKPPAVNFNHQ